MRHAVPLSMSVHVWLILHSKTYRFIEHTVCLAKKGKWGLDREH